MSNISEKERIILSEYLRKIFFIDDNLTLEVYWPPKDKFYYRFVVKNDSFNHIEPLCTELFESDSLANDELFRFLNADNYVSFMEYAIPNKVYFKDENKRITSLTFDARVLNGETRTLNQLRIEYEPNKQYKFIGNIKIPGFDNYTPDGITCSFDKNSKFLYSVCMKPSKEEQASAKRTYVILDGDFNPIERETKFYRVCRETIETEGRKESCLMFSNDLLPKPNKCSFSYSGRVDGKGSITLETKTRFHIYQDNLQPVQCLPGFNIEKLNIVGSSFKMKNSFQEREYFFKGELNEEGQIVGDMSIITRRQVPDTVYIDRSTLKLDINVIKEMVPDEKSNMYAVIDLLHKNKDNKSFIIDYQQEESNYIIGHYQSGSYTSNKKLLEKNDEGYSLLEGVLNPIEYELLPNNDLIVLQEDEVVVIFDGETKAPKARIISKETGEITFAIVGESGDYILSGFKDEDEGIVTKIGGVVCTASSDQFIEIDVSEDTTLNTIIEKAQEEIAKYGGKPAYKGKRPVNSIKRGNN